MIMDKNVSLLFCSKKTTTCICVISCMHRTHESENCTVLLLRLFVFCIRECYQNVPWHAAAVNQSGGWLCKLIVSIYFLYLPSLPLV